QKTIDQINQYLNKPGVAPTKNADVKCGDKDCYDVTLNLTSDDLSGITSGLASGAPSGTGTIEVQVDKGTLRPAKVVINAQAADQARTGRAWTVRTSAAASPSPPPADSDIAPAAS